MKVVKKELVNDDEVQSFDDYGDNDNGDNDVGSAGGDDGGDGCGGNGDVMRLCFQ